MKLSTNEVTLIGFVGGDAQAKQTRNKNNYTVVNLATNDSWKDKQTGEWQKRTQWHRLVGWAKTGESMLALTKGAFIQVRGSIRSYVSFRQGCVDEKRRPISSSYRVLEGGQSYVRSFGALQR